MPSVAQTLASTVLPLLKDLQHEAKEGIRLAEDSSVWCKQVLAQHANLTFTSKSQQSDAEVARQQAITVEEKLKNELGAAEKQLGAKEIQVGHVNNSAKAATAEYITEEADLLRTRANAGDALRLVKAAVTQGMRTHLAGGSEEMAVSPDLLHQLLQLESSDVLSASERGLVSEYLKNTKNLSSAEALLEALGGIASRLRALDDVAALDHSSELEKGETNTEDLEFASMKLRATVAAIQVQLAQKKRSRVRFDRTISEITTLLSVAESSYAAVADICEAHKQEKIQVSHFIQAETAAVKKMLAKSPPRVGEASASPSFLQMKAEQQQPDDLADTLQNIEQMMASLPPEAGGAPAAADVSKGSAGGTTAGGGPATSRGSPSEDMTTSSGKSGNAGDEGAAHKVILPSAPRKATSFASLCAAVERDLEADVASMSQAQSHTASQADAAKASLLEQEQRVDFLDGHRQTLQLALANFSGIAKRFARYRKASARTIGAHAKQLAPLTADLLAAQNPAGKVLQGLYQLLLAHRQALLETKIAKGASTNFVDGVYSMGRALLQLLAAGARRHQQSMGSAQAEVQFLSALSHRQLGLKQMLMLQGQAAEGYGSVRQLCSPPA